MRALVWSLVACGAGSEPQQPVDSPPKTPAIEPVRGSHGGAIRTIAITADGRAAVTADATGGLRLWPALDGTREPVAIHAQRAVALAIAHDGGGHAVAIVDSADHVELVRVDARGEVRSRRSLGTALQVEVAEHLLLLRPDQVIEQVALDGTPRGRLIADAGTQIHSLLVHDGRALALIASAQGKHARAIELPRLAWGRASPILPIADDGVVVFAPARDAIVARAASEHHITYVDLATGAAKPVCATSGLGSMSSSPARQGRFDLRFSSIPSQPLAVIGDRVACLVDDALTWWNLETAASTTANLGAARRELAFAVARDRLVFGHQHQLAMYTPERVEYLGYSVRDLANVRAVPTGLMIDKGDHQPLILDEQLRERARFVLPNLRVDSTDLVPIDDRFILTSSAQANGDVWGSAYQIAIYDSAERVMKQVLPQRARSGELAYEPATQLVVASDGDDTLLMELDREQPALGHPIVLELAETPTRVVLVDPALARGLVAIALRDAAAGVSEVFEFHRGDVPARSARGRRMRPRAAYEITGEVRAVDRAGHLYVTAANMVEVHAGRHVRSRLPVPGAASIRPSPDGKHVAVFEHGTITLYAIDGALQWRIAAWGASGVDWLAGGGLVVRFPSALARIELATGALRERQCGWAFGIGSTPRESSSSTTSVCDVAP